MLQIALSCAALLVNILVVLACLHGLIVVLDNILAIVMAGRCCDSSLNGLQCAGQLHTLLCHCEQT